MGNERAEHNRELEKIRATFFRETESYKIKLKKSEFLFERQFEAASQLNCVELDQAKGLMTLA